MNILVALGVGMLLCMIWLYRENKKSNKEPKRSQFLSNALVNERETTPEEVFSTLERAGIEPNFLGNESNL